MSASPKAGLYSLTPSEIFKRHRAQFLANDVRYIFDFDGTLADLHEDPQAVTLPEETLQDLLHLSPTHKENILILSGRDMNFLKKIFKDSAYLIGEHGVAKSSSTSMEVPERAFMFFEELIKTHSGSFLEKKKTSLSWHYRMVFPPLEERVLLDYQKALGKELKPHGFRCDRFSFILEAVPEASGKRRFIEDFLKTPSKEELLLCFGDDISEEEFFPLVEEQGGLSFAVGSKIKGGKHRFLSPSDLRKWISELARLIHSNRRPP